MKAKETICALDRLKYGGHTYSDSVTAKNAIDLINHLERESNKYRYKAQAQKGEIARLNKQVAEQKAEIEKLKKTAEEQHESCLIAMDVYKSEAIKDFAKRLKEKANSGFWDEYSYVDTEDIDNLVKEMVGENDG